MFDIFSRKKIASSTCLLYTSDIPSSEREFTLAKALKQELETLGLTNILLTDHCYVYAKLPATQMCIRDRESANVIAIIGDGSLSGGEALEGMDFAAELDSNMRCV